MGLGTCGCEFGKGMGAILYRRFAWQVSGSQHFRKSDWGCMDDDVQPIDQVGGREFFGRHVILT